MLLRYNNNEKNTPHGYHGAPNLTESTTLTGVNVKRHGHHEMFGAGREFGPQMDLTPGASQGVGWRKCMKRRGGPDRTRICDLYRVKVAL
jgi:hypothetical protein